MADEAKTTTLTISANFITAELKALAIQKGWEEMVTEFKEDAVQGRIRSETPNPQTFQEFVSESLNESVLKSLTESSINVIEARIALEKKDEIDLAKLKLKDAFSIDIK